MRTLPARATLPPPTPAFTGAETAVFFGTTLAGAIVVFSVTGAAAPGAFIGAAIGLGLIELRRRATRPTSTPSGVRQDVRHRTALHD